MSDGQLPLQGVTVLDVSRVLSGPYCTFLLAQLGARVIKVELPGTGDDSRQFGPAVGGVSGYFASVNRGKESIALDLKSAEDREIFEALLQQADVLIENFRPGVMDRLGYGWEAIHSRYPRVIYGSISGFGKSKTGSDAPAYDIIIQALSGIMSLTGKEVGDHNRVGVSIADLSSGLFLAIGVLAGLVQRQRTGAGDVVDIAMLDSVLSLMEYPVMRYAVSGVSPGPVGTYRPAIPPPFGMFRARDRMMVIAAGNDRLFAEVCRALSMSSSFVERYADAEVRKGHEHDIVSEIDSVLAERDAEAWVEILQQHNVPCAIINDVEAAVSLPSVRCRQLLQPQPPGDGSPWFLMSSPIHFPGKQQPESCGKAPALDEHRSRILETIRTAER